MKPNDERKLTFDEQVEALLKTMVPLKPKLKPKPQPKPAAVKAVERWSGDKPLSAVLQDAQRADEAATERLRQEREEMVELAGSNDYGKTIRKRNLSLTGWRLENYQQAIDAAWERSMDYRAELARWRDGEV